MAKDLATVVKESIQAGLSAVQREKEILQKRREDLEYQLQAINDKMLSLDGQLKSAVREAMAGMGISMAEPAKGKVKKGRTSKEEMARRQEAIVEIVRAAGKDGVGSGDIRNALTTRGMEVSVATLSNVIKSALEANAITKTGDRGSTRYHAE